MDEHPLEGELYDDELYDDDQEAPFQYTYRDWTLDEWSEANCYRLTRFTKAEILTLTVMLRIDEVEYNAGLTPSPQIACCVLLRRLAFGCRWIDLCELFGRSHSWLSTVFNCVVSYLNKTFGWLLNWHPRLRSYNRLYCFANAVKKKCYAPV